MRARHFVLAGGAVALAMVFFGSPATSLAAPASSPARSVPNAQVTTAPLPKAIDFEKLTQEATELLVKYIKINTTNPPGNELEAAKMLKEKFLSEGIPATTWEPEPGRGIVAARLRGIGRKQKALVLLSHMDVVPVDASEWKVPPFSGEIKDGSIWGRGAFDDKGPGVIEMISMLAIKRAGILLDRDIIFIATGDEEVGGKAGAEWFTEHERDIFSDAGYVLNLDAGGIIALDNGKKFYSVDVTEKTPLWLRLTTHGTEGHASVPPAQTAVTRLISALSRIMDFHPQIHVLGPVQDQFRVRAQLLRGPRQFLDLAASLQDAAFAREFLANPFQNASVRDTIAPTVLSAGFKTNILPQVAHAEIDCRLLPGEDQKHFVTTLEKLINDKEVKLEVTLSSSASSSPSKSVLMNALGQLAHQEDSAPAVPGMSLGYTDSRFFRKLNLVTYSFTPIDHTPGQPSGVHGIDEHIEIKHLARGIKRMTELLQIFGGTRK
jgi:acetylornithine deacetylase/succinyl-diaminopimelate desuccinylase-like protein